ncbi:hypothetical protein DSO57_1002108 [Entomophthora muscae]|uniref:Uncharacterized protein n=1 Tax=Entomophthora muscae TaxID=34485 RepID=A0ACC2TWM6_9FUNG|nr:hypothetical protein DSO57_1002108 [Entomophthora muscae]
MQFTFVPLFLALTSAQGYLRPSACRPLANGLISDCGSSTDAFQIKDVILTPSIPIAGQPLEIHLIGDLKKEITFGSVTSISTKINGSKLGTVELDTCAIAKERNLMVHCPAKPQHFDIKNTIKIPAYAPKGTYDINAFGFTHDKVRIFNVTIKHTSKDY